MFEMPGPIVVITNGIVRSFLYSSVIIYVCFRLLDTTFRIIEGVGAERRAPPIAAALIPFFALVLQPELYGTFFTESLAGKAGLIGWGVGFLLFFSILFGKFNLPKEGGFFSIIPSFSLSAVLTLILYGVMNYKDHRNEFNSLLLGIVVANAALLIIKPIILTLLTHAQKLLSSAKERLRRLKEGSREKATSP